MHHPISGSIKHCKNCGSSVVQRLPDDGDTRMRAVTLPAGFMELRETLAEGAARETDEEAGAVIEMQPLFTIIDVPRVGQVHFFFRAHLQSPDFHPGHETQEARLFTEADIPWDDLAFRTVKETLQYFFADRNKGEFELHTLSIH